MRQAGWGVRWTSHGTRADARSRGRGSGKRGGAIPAGLRVMAVAAIGLTLAGCWDSNDPKSMDMVEALGFQRSGPAGPGLSVLAEVPTQAFMAGLLGSAGGSGGGGGGGGQATSAPSYVMTATGATPPAGVDQMDARAGKALYLGQLRVVLVDENLARAGLGVLAGQLFRWASLPPGASLVVVDGSLPDLLSAKLVGTDMAGRFVDQYFRTAGPKTAMRVPLWSFFVDLHTPGVAPTLPVFGLTGLPGGRATLDAEGTALFRGGRMVGTLRGPADRGLLMWLNDFARQVLVVPGGSGEVTVQGVRASTTFGLRVRRAGPPVLWARVRVAGTVYAAPGILSLAEVRALRQRIAARVETEMRAALDAMQQSGADAIGAGLWLHYHDPGAFARLRPWAGTFAHLPLKLRATVSLDTTGWAP